MMIIKLTLRNLGFLVGVILISNVALARNTPIAKTITKRPTNSFYLSISGEGSFVSANYEKLLLLNSTSFITGRIGVGYAGNMLSENNSPHENYLTIPHHITANIGKKKHFFEFGLSGTFITENIEKRYFMGPLLGYRFQPLNSNKLNFRVFGSLPFTAYYAEILYIPIGASVGFCF